MTINLLLPMVLSKGKFETSGFNYPKILSEIRGRPIIEIALEKLLGSFPDKKVIAIVSDRDCRKFFVDDTIRLLAPGAKVVKTQRSTKGALCSALLGIEEIDEENPLIVSNFDQLIEADLGSIVQGFITEKCDAAVITFPSVHPQWSYIRRNEATEVVEVAEKHPISREAIAGFYFFRTGKLFVEAGFNAIRKDANFRGAYFTSAVLNEVLLLNGRISAHQIPRGNYHSFYSPKRVEEFEALMERRWRDEH